MVICLERGADLNMAQLMPLPLTVSCFSKIQIGFAFLVPAHLGSPGKTAVKRVCVCVTQDNHRERIQEHPLFTHSMPLPIYCRPQNSPCLVVRSDRLLFHNLIPGFYWS